MSDTLELDRYFRLKDADLEDPCNLPLCRNFGDRKHNECCGKVWCDEDLELHREEHEEG